MFEVLTVARRIVLCGPTRTLVLIRSSITTGVEFLDKAFDVEAATVAGTSISELLVSIFAGIAFSLDGQELVQPVVILHCFACSISSSNEYFV